MVLLGPTATEVGSTKRPSSAKSKLPRAIDAPARNPGETSGVAVKSASAPRCAPKREGRARILRPILLRSLDARDVNDACRRRRRRVGRWRSRLGRTRYADRKRIDHHDDAENHRIDQHPQSFDDPSIVLTARGAVVDSTAIVAFRRSLRPSMAIDTTIS